MNMKPKETPILTTNLTTPNRVMPTTQAPPIAWATMSPQQQIATLRNQFQVTFFQVEYLNYLVIIIFFDNFLTLVDFTFFQVEKFSTS